VKTLTQIAIVTALFLVSNERATADRLELVTHVNLWDDSPVRSSDASGLTYHAPSGHLLIADSEISEYGEMTDSMGVPIFSGFNVFETSLDLDTLFNAYFAPAYVGISTEPVGIAYNPADGHIYVTDDDQYRVYRYRFDSVGEGGVAFGPPIATEKIDFGERYADPEGIAYDARSGELYVASGSRDERVLKYRFHSDTNSFEYLDEFGVADHIRDPEGIGVDPATGNVFMVSEDGIAEFRPDGAFVQFFDFGFFNRPDVSSTLPGGLTFAPSSDPNDHPNTWSIYVSHRGIDNGKFPARNTLDGAISEIRLVRDRGIENPIRVPMEYPTIQAAIDAASDGDTILVSPGIYRESLVLRSKTIALLSEQFLLGPDAPGTSDLIDRTIIDGGGGSYAIEVAESVGRETTISGFTIRNADDGITAHGAFKLTYCHVTETTDGIDYEAGGGLVRYCRFTRNRDDGIDLDGATAATIEHNNIEDNGDDGIEIRLHPYTGEPLRIHIRNNMIARNGEDGVQLIDYDTMSSREFSIEGNYIVDNAMSGIGCMASANSTEDYSGAQLPERIIVANNTFAGNNHHLTGGANLLAVNNIFVRASTVAVRNTAGRSRFVHNLFWGNASQHQGPSLDIAESVLFDPLLDTSLRPLENSPVINAGVAITTWQGEPIEVVIPAEYRGRAPDLGAFERSRRR
jgi:hypothetical protein